MANTDDPGAPAGGSSGSPINWGKVGTLGAGIGGLLGSLFAGGQRDITPDVNSIQATAKNLGTQGAQLTAEGQANLAPVLKYFAALAGGDPSALLQATAPDRARVIDQYDAARRSSAQFTPRGGGQASTQQQARVSEAQTITTQTGLARTNAVNTLASLGSQQEQTGLSAQEASINALASVLQPILAQNAAKAKGSASFFTGLADIASIALDFIPGGGLASAGLKAAGI